MNAEAELCKLEELGFVGTDQDGKVYLDEDFLETRDAYQLELQENHRLDTLIKEPVNDSYADFLESVTVLDKEILSLILAVNESIPEEYDIADELNLVALLHILDHTDRDPTLIPTNFASIAPSWFEFFITVSNRTIFYIWREECPPCELVKKDLDKILHEPPENIALLAVYGPDIDRVLREEYNIVGAPTLLFIADGEIYVRLEGPHHKEVVEKEVESLTNL